MGLLGRLGNVGQVLLEQQLKDDEKKQETEALYRQQQQLQASGILGTMAQHVGEKAAAGQQVDYSKLPPGIAEIIRGYEGVAPSDQQKTGELVGEWGKIAKPEGAPTREEVLAQMQGKGINTGDVINLTHRQQFSDANGSYGDGEEGLLPAFTRGAAEESPLVTQAGTAAGAIRGRLQQGVEDEQKRAIDTEAQKKLLPGRPEMIGVIQLDQNGKPMPNGAYVLGPNGQPIPASAADRDNPDVEGRTQMPQQPGYASIYANSTPMTPDEAKYWAQRVVETGSWAGLPPMGGPAGMKNQKLVESLVPHFHTGTGWDATTPGSTTAPDQSLATNKIDYDAGHRTTADLTGNIAALNSYEESAKQNGALLKTVAAQIPGSQWPAFLATPVRDIARVWGDPVMRQFEVYRQSVSKEYGRITTQPTLKGVFSVQGMLDANTTMPDNATANGLIAAVDAFDKEAHNRQKAYLDELERQRAGATNGGAGGPNRLGGQVPATPSHRPGVVRR